MARVAFFLRCLFLSRQLGAIMDRSFFYTLGSPRRLSARIRTQKGETSRSARCFRQLQSKLKGKNLQRRMLTSPIHPAPFIIERARGGRYDQRDFLGELALDRSAQARRAERAALDPKLSAIATLPTTDFGSRADNKAGHRDVGSSKACGNRNRLRICSRRSLRSFR